MMFNGDMIKRATMTGENGSTFLDHVASNSRLSPIDKVNYLYMAGLARRPNSIELKGLQNSVTSANTLGQLQDIWWAILNSNEFILNH